MEKDKRRIRGNKGMKRVREGKSAVGARECFFLDIKLELLMAALIEWTG
jgi:hypothetical protein